MLYCVILSLRGERFYGNNRALNHPAATNGMRAEPGERVRNRKQQAKMAIRKPQKAVEKTGARYDELLAALNRQDSVPSPGTIVKGKVTGKRGNEILVDIGCKSAGAIPANEFENADEVKAGDEFDVLLIDLEGENGMVVVSKRQADEKIRWEAILAKYKEGDTVSTGDALIVVA